MLTLNSGQVETTPTPSGTRTTTNEIDIIISNSNFSFNSGAPTLNSNTPSSSSTKVTKTATGISNVLTMVGKHPGVGEEGVPGPHTTLRGVGRVEHLTSSSTFSSTSSSTSSSSLPNPGSNSHIGVIVGGAVGGRVALAITIIVLVLVGIWWKWYKLKEMFLKLETKLAMPVLAIDHAGAGEGVPGAGGEITSGSGSHRAGFEAASPYPLKHYPTYSAMILLPPTMSAGHDAVSIVGSRNSGSGRRSSRNMFIHRDREMVSINVDMLQGRVQEEVESQLEEQVPEEILPTYESLMSDLMTVGIQSRSSEHNGGRSRSGVGGSGELGVVENSTKWTTQRFGST
ncbi:hypothetical protein F5877DRAFT_84985 [Lentinula edodes]|nr:hypothetical protein F5877DRAFT_84985 [Lentinula edodes]